MHNRDFRPGAELGIRYRSTFGHDTAISHKVNYLSGD